MKQVLRSDTRLHIVLMVTYNMDWPAAGVVGVVANKVRLAVSYQTHSNTTKARVINPYQYNT